jgi:5-methylcytosine-specific restriction enzyme subunit McrC
MSIHRQHITVFEHERIKLDQVINGCTFDAAKLLALQNYYGDKGVPYYSLIHKGVQFNEYVGVIQVDNLLIEVLPKADKVAHSVSEDKKWRDMLIGMMRAVGIFDIKVTSKANLRIKPNTILDLYIEKYLTEVEYLLHTGLVKKYRKTESNATALKGSLMFGKHIQQNLTHQERFYVRHTTYDTNHTLHSILYTALRFISQINTNAGLHSRIGALLLYFPEMPVIRVTEATFNNISYNRKTEGYRTAIDIARMLLLRYHPDVSRGQNNVLALMFDMNKLWEQFVFISLRKHATDWQVSAQLSKDFWQPDKGYKTRIRPDIVLKHKTDKRCIVLDTKWKNLNGYNPSPDDLRQMYVYHEYFEAEKTALIYPGEGERRDGTYFKIGNYPISGNLQCTVLPIAVTTTSVKVWQKEIEDSICDWMKKANFIN